MTSGYEGYPLHRLQAKVMITTGKERKTYADYAALDEGAPYQLIDGELVMSPSPTRSHQAVLLRLALMLQRFVVENSLGEVYVAPFDVKFSETEVYQPDLLFISADRLTIIAEQQVNGAPDLVVEVLSPATGYYDLTKKRRVYEVSGVKEYWIVDPTERTVEVLENVEGTYKTAAKAHQKGRVPSRVLEGFEIDLERLFSF